MTDEEKAEEYLEKHKEITHIKGIYHLTINEKQAYLDGLAEGRKEIRDRVADVPYTILKECASERLKKENAELHAEIAELKEKHESNKRALKLIIEKGVNLEKENEELKAQIEEMKCCGNCKHEIEKLMFPTTDEAEDIICDHCKKRNKWELAD